jgi:nitrate reductase NapAB chaperone NapD
MCGPAHTKDHSVKLLNIDAYAAPKRSLKMFGKQHEVRDLDVDMFIENITIAQSLEAAEKQGLLQDDAALIQHITESVKSIVRAVPTLDEVEVRRLSVAQLGLVLEFVRGDLDVTADGMVKQVENVVQATDTQAAGGEDADAAETKS